MIQLKVCCRDQGGAPGPRTLEAGANGRTNEEAGREHGADMAMQSMLNVIDNSGAAVAECVKVLKMKRAAKVGMPPSYTLTRRSSQPKAHPRYGKCPPKPATANIPLRRRSHNSRRAETA